MPIFESTVYIYTSIYLHFLLYCGQYERLGWVVQWLCTVTLTSPVQGGAPPLVQDDGRVSTSHCNPLKNVAFQRWLSICLAINLLSISIYLYTYSFVCIVHICRYDSVTLWLFDNVEHHLWPQMVGMVSSSHCNLECRRWVSIIESDR